MNLNIARVPPMIRSQMIYDVNVTQVKKLTKELEIREAMKDKITLAMNLRIAKNNMAVKLQKTDSQRILTKNGHRITEELWCIPIPNPTPASWPQTLGWVRVRVGVG